MSVLGPPQGLFVLNDSDKAVGSLIRFEDVQEILGVAEQDLAEVEFMVQGEERFIDERELQQLWYDKAIPNAPAPRIGNATISFDEMILAALARRALPGAVIEAQVPWGRKKIDLSIRYGGERKLVEFFGPNHFAPGRYGTPTASPLVRKAEAEKVFACEHVIWPYWIQRCEANVRALFDDTVEGLGALWSTNTHFGDFVFPDSANVIDRITRRFNAVDDSGYGYFYEANSRGRSKPEHPIVQRSKANRDLVARLIPRGASNEAYWLPTELKTLS